jgi:2-phospho-L-lactate/phosphoenolpyruvate guanylyltransferase
MSHEGRIWAVVPVKRFSASKRRLAPVLDAGERSAVARLMLDDVLDVLFQCQGVLSGTAVVTADVDAAAQAREGGATVVLDDGDRGINAAVDLAIGHLAANGNDGIMVVPSDIPHLSRDAIVTAAEALASPRTLAIARAADGGTNLLACRPARAVPLCFGPDSFDRHSRAALQAGITVRVLSLSELSLDIDRPENLRTFLSLNSKTRTHAFLSRLGIGARLEWGDRHEARPAGWTAAGAWP